MSGSVVFNDDVAVVDEDIIDEVANLVCAFLADVSGRD